MITSHWSLRRRIVDALMYAVVTAGVILGIAILLSQSSVQARTLAYQEIHEHRLAFTCYRAEVTDAMNSLLEAHGLQLMAEPDTNGIDCAAVSIPDEDDLAQ